MTLKMALKHWLNKSYPTIEEMFEDQFEISKGGYCIDVGNCMSCIAAVKKPDKPYYGNVRCVKAINYKYVEEMIGGEELMEIYKCFAHDKAFILNNIKLQKEKLK